MRSKYFIVELWPYNLPWFINLYMSADKAWNFEKLVFELEAFGFKIDCILVFQLMSVNKKMVVSSGKFIIFISWSPICTPLILMLASMKIASTL